MNKTQNLIPDVYEEDSRLTVEISAILSDHCLSHKKENKLIKLQESAASPLAQSHVAYYINRIRNKRRALCARIIAMIFILAYLFYILYRIYYELLYPEKPHYNLAPGLTNIQQTLFICMLPAFVLLCYLIRVFLSERQKF